MGCTFSGLNALYEAVSGAGDVWVNDRKFRILKQLGEGGFAFVYLVKEVQGERTIKAESLHEAEDGLYALKKVLIQSDEQLSLVKHEIHVASLFKHPNLLPLLEHSMIAVKGSQEGTWNTEAFLLFPVHPDGTLQDHLDSMRSKGEFFPAITVLHIFKQICEGLRHIHKFEPAYVHNDIKPGNVLLSKRKDEPPLAVIMDFGSCTVAKKRVRSRSEALGIQEWAAQQCSAPYRAPELWDCPSIMDIDERVDVWSLGCTLYAIMYCVSPFEYTLGEAGGSLQLAVMSGRVRWPAHPNPPYPTSFQKLVSWMLELRVAVRPDIDSIIIHVDKLISTFASQPPE